MVSIQRLFNNFQKRYLMLLISWLWMACQSQPKWDDDTLNRLAADPQQLKLTLAQEPVESRDLLLLTLAIRNPTIGGQFCKQVRSNVAKENCQQVIGRPHLQLNEAQPNDVNRTLRKR